MAKIYGLFGAMTGKLADTVMTVRNGEQIARKYQPIVSNPSTVAQTAQRAKMKLLSQLSAVMAPVIAIPRNGSVSSRNLFTKVNFPLTSYSENTADITLANVQLTSSVVGLPAISVNRATNDIVASISDVTSILDVDRIVYALFEKGADNKLRFVQSVVATERGSEFDWRVRFASNPNACVILAYGVRDNNENARVTFGNLEALTAETIAKVVVMRTLTESDITLTETKGAELAAASQS